VDEKGQKGNRNQIEGKHIEGVVDEFLPGRRRKQEGIFSTELADLAIHEVDVQTHDERCESQG